VGCIRSDLSLLVGTEAETLWILTALAGYKMLCFSKYKTTLHIRQSHLPLTFRVQEIACTEHA